MALAEGGLQGWRLLAADASSGIIEAEATSRVLRRRSSVHIRVALDANAQTRVDLRVRALTGRFPHLGRNARFVGAYVSGLDRAAGANARNTLHAGAVAPGTGEGTVGRRRR